jgi:hypothetical protein
MDFTYLGGADWETSCNCFEWGREVLRGRGDGGSENNVQCKSDWNCHYESPPYNEYMLIKFYNKNYTLHIPEIFILLQRSTVWIVSNSHDPWFSSPISEISVTKGSKYPLAGRR